jgi:uncharacterized protein (TIGR02996 family)
MNRRAEFLRAIEADPDDDGIRLVFADWLEENDDPDRARFIRLQCDPVGQSEQRRRGREIKALLKRHRAEWTAGLPAWAAQEEFRRGFPNITRMTAQQFLEDAAAVRAVAPLDTLSLWLLKGRERKVFASEHLGGVSRLSVANAQLTDEGMAALTSSPHLGRLRHLDASRTYNTNKDVNRLTDAAAVALAGADNLPALTGLHLAGFKTITVAGFRAIIESPRRAGLTALTIYCRPGGPEVGELFRGPRYRLTGLRELWLLNCDLGNDGAEALAGAAALANLRLLWVPEGKIGNRGAAALASSPHLSGLVELSLWKDALTDAGVLAILASKHLAGVRKLDLGENPKVTDASARAILADGRDWENVGLYGTQMSPTLAAKIRARCR